MSWTEELSILVQRAGACEGRLSPGGCGLEAGAAAGGAGAAGPRAWTRALQHIERTSQPPGRSRVTPNPSDSAPPKGDRKSQPPRCTARGSKERPKVPAGGRHGSYGAKRHPARPPPAAARGEEACAPGSTKRHLRPGLPQPGGSAPPRMEWGGGARLDRTRCSRAAREVAQAGPTCRGRV